MPDKFRKPVLLFLHPNRQVYRSLEKLSVQLHCRRYMRKGDVQLADEPKAMCVSLQHIDAPQSIIATFSFPVVAKVTRSHWSISMHS